MPDPSAFAPVTDALGAHAGKLLALSGAGGLLGGYLSSQEKGNPHETPADRRKRILKNALGYALATGGIGATGLGAASLLASTEGTEGGVSPWKNTLGRGLIGSVGALGAKWGVSPRFRNNLSGDKSLNEAVKMLGKHGLVGVDAQNQPVAMTPAQMRSAAPSHLTDLARKAGITSPRDTLKFYDHMRRGNAGEGGVLSPGYRAFYNDVHGSNAASAPVAFRGNAALAAVKRNRLPIGAGVVAAIAPQLANWTGSLLGATAD